MSVYESEVVDADTEKVEEPQTAELPAEEAEKPQVETPEPTNEEEAKQSEEALEAKTEDNGLVKLPDGRELTPEQVKDEYLRLNSDYTRKSQKLSNYEKGNINNNNKAYEEKSEEDWVPETYDDLYENFKQRQQKEAQDELQKHQDIQDDVSRQLEELKKLDPSLNDSELFGHAIKYGFKDLPSAHSNMKDMHQAINKTKEDTVKNLQKRNADPVSGVPDSGNSVEGNEYNPGIRNMSAVDYLNSL